MFLIPDSSWEVRDVPNQGRGVFAKTEIPAGTVIGDYLGKVIHTRDEDKLDKKGAHFYLMYYHDTASIYPDLSRPGVHLINHSCAPNCWMYTYHGHTLFFAIRRILKGEQITLSYQLSPLDSDCAPCDHPCKCGSLLCTGTIHSTPERFDEWLKFLDIQEAKTPRERIHFNESLAALPSYPKSIPDNPIYTLFGAKDHLSVKIMDRKVPSKAEVRKIIRETGRTIQFYNLDLKVHGVIDDLLISQSNKSKLSV